MYHDYGGKAIVRCAPEGYQMISSFEIRNYRCFKEVKKTAMKRFTFVVGKSGTGKTALLESLFLTAGGNPEIYFRLRRWRGFGDSIELSGTRLNYESVFRDLFHKFNQEEGVRIGIEDTSQGYRKLEISYQGSDTLDLPLKATSGRSEDSFTVLPITFKWDTPKKVITSKVEVGPNGLRMSGSQEVLPMTFLSSHTINAKDNATKFSELSKRNSVGPIVDALKGVFHDVKGLSLELVGGEPILHVDIPSLNERLPLVVLSGGMNKYLSIVLAILSSKGGTVIVDEIENGFYYDNLPVILSTIVNLCRITQTQLIASTHSYEMLKALSSIMDEYLEKHCELLRLEQESPGEQPTVRTIAGENCKAAIESGFEVR